MGGLDPWRRRQDLPENSRILCRETTSTEEPKMAQPKKLTPENLDKELEVLKEQREAAEAVNTEAWRLFNEADKAKKELQQKEIFLQTAKEMIGEPIKAQIAYARGLAAGKDVQLENPQESLSELLSQFKVQDEEAPTPAKKGRAAKVAAPVKAEKAEEPKVRRKRRTKAEMEAAKAAEGIADVSPAAAMASLVDPVEEYVDETEFDDGDYDD
jgi:hypothetical protein